MCQASNFNLKLIVYDGCLLFKLEKIDLKKKNNDIEIILA